MADVTAAENHGLELVRTTGAYFVNQFHNDNNCLSHERTTGPEIWKQTGGKIDAFLATVIIYRLLYVAQSHFEIQMKLIIPYV